MIVVRHLKGGQRRYLARYEGPFGREVARTFSNRSEAQAWERSVKEAARSGTGLPAPRSVRVRPLSAWWADACAGARWQARTEARYRELWRLHVAPVWGRVTAERVTRGGVRRWVADLERDGLAPATVAQAVTVLSAALREAIDAGVLQANPCRGARPRSSPPEARRALTVQEVGRLVAAAPARTAPVYRLAAVVGLRFGELVGLEVGDVDVDAGVVHVRRAVIEVAGHQSVKPFPKGGAASRRAVAVPRAVVDGLAPLLVDRPSDAPLWASASGGRVWYSTEARLLVEAFTRAGAVGASGFHVLRRTAATLALQNQASPRDVQAMLGHSSPAMTLTRYAQPDLSMQRDAVERVAAAIEQAAHELPPGQKPDTSVGPVDHSN